MAEVLPIEKRIRRSRRARAVERAWKVAKAIEGNREQIEGLTWVEPQQGEDRGITRRIDFDQEYLPEREGVRSLYPVPMDVAVIAPASALVPGEDIKVAWTMPLLSRVRETASSLDDSVKYSLGFDHNDPSVRHTIDVVSFLPFPKADAPEEERFNPEFLVTLNVHADLGEQTIVPDITF